MSSNGFQEAFGDLKRSEFYNAPTDAAPVPRGSSSSSAILVHPCQKGNPLLRAVGSVPWEYSSDLQADYVLGSDTCALYLSLRYHQLNPDYLQRRLDALGAGFRLRVLLVQVDVLQPQRALHQLTLLTLRCRLTLMLAWSSDEAGRVLATYKAYEHKPATLIQPTGGGDGTARAQLCDALAGIRAVSRTDAATLLQTFGTVRRLLDASEDQLAACPGVGPGKAAKIHRVLHMPVRKQPKTRTE